MNPHYALLTNETDYQEAIELVLRKAENELLIVDRDLAKLKIETRSRADLLTEFLAQDRLRRIRIVIHDPALARDRSPRLLQLLARYSHAVLCRQSPPSLRHVADTHVIADGVHGVRRFHFDQARSALITDDPKYLRPWQLRFEELWEQSEVCLFHHTTGL